MSGTKIISISVGCLLSAQSAYGQIYLTFANCIGEPDASDYLIEQVGVDEFDVFLLDNIPPQFFEIHSDSVGQTLQNIYAIPTGTIVIRVTPDCVDDTIRIQDIWNIQGVEGQTHIVNRVNIAGDLGTVSAHTIGDLLPAGDITGNIMAYNGNVASGITKVQAGGSIYGDIRSPEGRIAFIRADGDIGTPGSPILIEAKFGVYDIALAQNVYADINARVNDGTGIISRMIVDTFVGSLEARILSVFPGGTALLRFNAQLDATITFGESYAGVNRTIEVPVGGLTTQIIINADNVGAVWDAPVWIGFDGDPDQIILTGPGYTNTAKSLGGGSVGLAPFDLHDESCVPANGDTVLLKDADPDLQVKLRHYGPITLNANAPVTIERRVACTMDSFGGLPATDFVYSVDPADGNSLLVSGAPGAAGFETGYEYRLIATADLMCDQVAGNPPVSWDSPDYRVTVRPGCLADLDGDDNVGASDLLILLVNWGPCPGCSADLDCDGNVGAADLLMLLGAWGPCGTPSLGAPKTVDDCIDKFFYQIYDPLALEKCLEAVGE